MYSNCCCSCLFEAENIKIGQSFHKIYCNNIVNFQESTTTLNARTKKSRNLSYAAHIYIYMDVCLVSGHQSQRYSYVQHLLSSIR